MVTAAVELSVVPRLMTVAEFERLADAPENADRRFELIYGEIVEKMPTEEHAALAANVVGFIWVHDRSNNLGGRAAVEPRHQASDDDHNARLPDIAYTTAARLLPLTTKGSVPQMPDLAIKIQSPNDRPHELREKAVYYLRHGSQRVWLLYPAPRQIEVCRLNENGVLAIQVLNADDTLDGGDLLPGFSVPVSAIFDVK